jgi:O-antigen ligase
MILWGLFWILENGSGFNKITFKGNKPAFLFILFIGLFIWQIAGLLFADSLNMGIERISKRLSFFLFPLVLFYPGGKISKNINQIIRLFPICTFLYIIYCFGNALHNSLILQDGKWIFNPHPLAFDFENHFFGLRFSDIVHPSYLAMYVLISILISSESLFDNSLTVIKRCLWLIISIVFLIVIYLLSSRAGVMAAMIVLPLYFLFKFYRKFSKWIIVLLLIILVTGLVVLVRTNSRINYSLEGISKTNINETVEKDVRFIIWKSAMGVIEQNLILGVGTGDASEELKKEFTRRGYVEGYYDTLNAHNQYIEILLENGLIGLILFLSILGYMSYIAISQQNLLLGLFIIMMVVFFLFETVLNRLAGITFFPFFTFLFMHVKARTGN